jgi:hypothetical protein
MVYFVPSLFLKEEKNRAIYSCLILKRFTNEILAYGEMVLGKESSNYQNMTRSGWMGLGKGYH